MMTRKLNLFFIKCCQIEHIRICAGNYTRCRMSGVKCLNKYDGKFLIYLPINFKIVQTLYIHLNKKFLIFWVVPLSKGKK